MSYVPTIGLEIHAELKTKSKMFCGCANNPDEVKPNFNTCPICLGHPGTLPVPNAEAVNHVIQIGRSVNGTIADFTEWDRKHYFYPDIPKGYQISQYKYPLVNGGEIAGVKITRIHLEEDTARSTHDQGDYSLVDFNRSGVPLMELVTEPVIHDAKTAVNFAKELQRLLHYLDVGEANLEKGEMRIEANISVCKTEIDENGYSKKLGTKTEVKNLNSFRSVERAIDYEIKRQIDLIESGEQVVQETRGFDENTGKTFSQRAKESSHDYRYFPEPDITKFKISEFMKQSGTKQDTTIELPWDKRSRYRSDFEMTDKEAEVFVDSQPLSKYFEAVIAFLTETTSKSTSKQSVDIKKTIKLSVNYLLSEYLGLLKKAFPENFENHIGKVPANDFAALILMVASGEISSRGFKDVLAHIFEKGGIPAEVVKLLNLTQNHDTNAIEKIVKDLIQSNPAAVADFRSGKGSALQFLIGQGMKLTKGSANPELLKTLITKNLS